MTAHVISMYRFGSSMISPYAERSDELPGVKLARALRKQRP